VSGVANGKNYCGKFERVLDKELSESLALFIFYSTAIFFPLSLATPALHDSPLLLPKGEINSRGKKLMEKIKNIRKYYLSEFIFNDKVCDITFNIIDINTVKNEITVAVSKQGKVSVCTFELKTDNEQCWFFEYGVMQDKISVDDFEQIEEDF